MKKIHINDLTKEQLDEFCARAQPGWTPHYSADGDELLAFDMGTANARGCRFIMLTDYYPTTNDAQAMALVKEFGVSICTRFSRDGGLYYHVQVGPEEPENASMQLSQTDLNIAICRAVVASVFGNEVTIDD